MVLGAYHGSSLLASQANGLVQQLGHLLVVGMVLPPGPAGHKPIVLQLGDVLLREPLSATAYFDADDGVNKGANNGADDGDDDGADVNQS